MPSVGFSLAVLDCSIVGIKGSDSANQSDSDTLKEVYWGQWDGHLTTGLLMGHKLIVNVNLKLSIIRCWSAFKRRNVLISEVGKQISCVMPLLSFQFHPFFFNYTSYVSHHYSMIKERDPFGFLHQCPNDELHELEYTAVSEGTCWYDCLSLGQSNEIDLRSSES